MHRRPVAHMLQTPPHTSPPQHAAEALEPGPSSSPSPDSPQSPGLAALPPQALSGRDDRDENFTVLSRLVPGDLRPRFRAVYDFCRFADDLSDENDGSNAALAHAREMIDAARIELDHAAAGTATHPLFVALGRTLQSKSLPIEPFHDLLRAFEQDTRVRDYGTWNELLAYCEWSANPVGRIVLMLGGIAPPAVESRNADLYRRSDLICTALQLTNHWQDLRRDLLERNRCYLPHDLTCWTRAQLQDWATRGHDPAVRVPFILGLRPLVDRTRAMFIEGQSLADDVPPTLAPVIRLFIEGGRGTLERIEAVGCTTLWARPALSKVSKVILIAEALLRAKLAGRRDPLTARAQEVAR